ncbi:hypothetical protein GCM10011578_070270 [Streptomyces fuscichromogenes]|uniref:Uncharacterized protein n=1 Tax=Streptomyces fuscichromogenes TaxID=1324013 RepID=A0A917XJJ3_9ACTN|nr:hypothetical protein GCM10011578_070270 [Streptomyces fuscichromogenes]
MVEIARKEHRPGPLTPAPPIDGSADPSPLPTRGSANMPSKGWPMVIGGLPGPRITMVGWAVNSPMPVPVSRFSRTGCVPAAPEQMPRQQGMTTAMSRPLPLDQVLPGR